MRGNKRDIHCSLSSAEVYTLRLELDDQLKNMLAIEEDCKMETSEC